MSLTKIKYSCFFFILLNYQNTKAQLLSNLDTYHNQVFVGSGYTLSFGNITYGIQHTRYFRRIKKNISGILDFSTPLSQRFYTRFVFRKGFQLDVYHKHDFRIPLAIITSSAKEHLRLFNFHDVVTDFYILPGIYTKKYTIAADLDFKVIWFRKTHYDQNYFVEVNPDARNGWEKHIRCKINLGMALGYNLTRLTFLVRGGYQQVADWEAVKFPFYAFGMIGYKFNFIKNNHNLQPQDTR